MGFNRVSTKAMGCIGLFLAGLCSTHSQAQSVDIRSTVGFANQDTNTGQVALYEGGLYLQGNRWQATQGYYNVTANTVLEFEFATNNIGEIHGIGLDDDNRVTQSRIFSLAGTQNWGRKDVVSYKANLGQVQKFSIPIGKYYQGENMRVILVNDKDVNNPTNTSWFRNVKLITPDIITPEPPSCTISPIQQQLLDAHNRARATGRYCGATFMAAAAGLSWSCKLGEAAANHSQDMATTDYFSHTGSDGLSPFDRMDDVEYVYRAAGENIAAGYDSVESVVTGWLQSPGHCENIMSPNFKEMGGALIENSAAAYRYYWTVDFGTPR